MRGVMGSCGWTADERLPEPSRDKLGALLGGLGSEDAGYLLRLITRVRGGVVTRDVLQLRLFKNDPRVRWTYRIHEQLGIAAQRVGWELRQTDIAVLHLGYEVPARSRASSKETSAWWRSRAASSRTTACSSTTSATTLLDMRRADEAIAAFDVCAPLVEGTTLAQSVPALKSARVHLGRPPGRGPSTKCGPGSRRCPATRRSSSTRQSSLPRKGS